MTYNIKQETTKITLEMSEVEFNVMLDITSTLDMLLEGDFNIKELLTLLIEKTFRYDDKTILTLTKNEKAAPGPHDC